MTLCYSNVSALLHFEYNKELFVIPAMWCHDNISTYSVKMPFRMEVSLTMVKIYLPTVKAFL